MILYRSFKIQFPTLDNCLLSHQRKKILPLYLHFKKSTPGSTQKKFNKGQETQLLHFLVSAWETNSEHAQKYPWYKSAGYKQAALPCFISSLPLKSLKPIEKDANVYNNALTKTKQKHSQTFIFFGRT